MLGARRGRCLMGWFLLLDGDAVPSLTLLALLAPCADDETAGSGCSSWSDEGRACGLKRLVRGRRWSCRRSWLTLCNRSGGRLAVFSAFDDVCGSRGGSCLPLEAAKATRDGDLVGQAVAGRILAVALLVDLVLQPADVGAARREIGVLLDELNLGRSKTDTGSGCSHAVRVHGMAMVRRVDDGDFNSWGGACCRVGLRNLSNVHRHGTVDQLGA